MRLCTSVTDFEVDRAKNQLKTAILSDILDTSKACSQVARQVAVTSYHILALCVISVGVL